MKKRLTVVVCCLFLLITCLTAFAACANVMDDDTLNDLLIALKNDYNGKTTSKDFTLPGQLDTTDARGDDTTVYIKWQLKGTTLVTVGKRDENGRCTVTIDPSLEKTTPFELTATLTNSNGKAYTDSNKQAYTVTLKMTALVEGDDGNQGDQGNQGNQGGTGDNTGSGDNTGDNTGNGGNTGDNTGSGDNTGNGDNTGSGDTGTGGNTGDNTGNGGNTGDNTGNSGNTGDNTGSDDNTGSGDDNSDDNGNSEELKLVATIDLKGITTRTTFDDSQIVHKSGNAVYTYIKGNATTNNYDNTDHADYATRAYAKGTFTVSFTTAIKKIVIKCDSATYSGKTYYSGMDGMTVAGATITVDGATTTVILDTPSLSFTTAELLSQMRIESIEIYA